MPASLLVTRVLGFLRFGERDYRMLGAACRAAANEAEKGGDLDRAARYRELAIKMDLAARVL